MSRFKTTVSLLGAGAIALALTACGGSDDSEYCDLLESAQEEFGDMTTSADPSDTELTADLATAFNDIADAAPDDVSGDWQTVAEGFQAFSEIDMEDPEAIAELDSSAFENMDGAMESINEHVQEECDIEL